MSYTTIKNGLIGILNGLNLVEEKETVDFKNKTAINFDNRYILTVNSGDKGEYTDTLADRMYDYQEWDIKIAYNRSENNDVVQYDKMHAKREEIMQTFDDPDNWSGIAQLIRYNGWKVEDLSSYYLLTIQYVVKDTILH